MTLTDQRGNPVSTDRRSSLDGYERAQGLLAGYFADPLAVIDEVLAEDPDFVMGHCFRGALFLMTTERTAEPELAKSVAAAAALAGRANDRERQHIAALQAWLDGDFRRASDLYAWITINYPRDLLALQVGHLTDFLLGRAHSLRDRVARTLYRWDEGVPGFGFVLGMHAFGLEESGDYARAEEAGRRAVELNPKDAWAIHAVAHVLEMQARMDEGKGWLTPRADDWAPGNMLAYHNWWHLALFHLDSGDGKRALEIYDTWIRSEPSTIAMEMVDAAALLWRLRLRGIDVGQRWSELADAWATRAEEGYYAFNETHAMMAFVAAGRGEDAKRTLASLERSAAGNGANAQMAGEVGLPVARAIQAFADEDYRQAAELLLSVRPIAQRFGGSHAQRDVLSLTLLEAAFRAKDGRLARALAAERSALRPDNPFNRLALARAQTMERDPYAMGLMVVGGDGRSAA